MWRGDWSRDQAFVVAGPLFHLRALNTGDSIFDLGTNAYQGATMTKEQEEQGFRITDKRSFAEDARPDAGTAESASLHNIESERQMAPDGSQSPPVVPQEEGAHIDFPSYILSYYTQGLVMMGEVPNPYTSKKEEDLEAARHIVDILSMLEEKTKGNLNKQEEQLLGSVLYELRMKYMAKTSRIKL
jgi:hypothetical protein